MAFDKRKALQNALAYTQQGKWDRAITEYQSILKTDPRDVTVCNNLGDLFARAGKTAEAIDQYLKLGELYRADGLSVKAIAVYKKIAKLDPASTEAYLACADLYWEQGLVGEAKIQMATVVEHFSRSGEPQKLIDAYKRLSQFDPTNPAVISRLADLMVREGMREAAAAEYERAAQAAQAAGQAAEAKRLLQKSRDLSPGVGRGKGDSAERLIAQGKLAEAVDVLKGVTSGEPDNAMAWRTLGETQASLQQCDEAVSSLQRAVALGVPESEVSKPLGLSLLRVGRAEDAVALSQRVLDAGRASGQPEAALACCRELMAAAPEIPDFHAHLAAALEGLGRVEEARAALRSLAAAQEAGGHAEAAVATYRRLLELNPSDAEAQARLEVLAPPAPPPPDTAALAESPLQDQDEVAVPVIVTPEVLETEGGDASLVSLEDLGLSLGADDAALLLEETDAEVADAKPGSTPPAPGATPTAAADTGEETPDETDWLTQELHAIDLDAVAADGPTAEVAWASGGASLDLEDISAGLGSSGLAALEPESPSALDASSGYPEVGGSTSDVPVVELPDVPPDSDASLLDVSRRAEEVSASAQPAEDPHASHVAEQLAEADVYQKYGLEEKARERLLEVVRLAPDSLTARRRLRAIYLDRRQTAEACAETLAIAGVLRGRNQEDAAVAEVREGLALVPDHPALLQFLVQAGSMEPQAGALPTPTVLAGPPPPGEQPAPGGATGSEPPPATPREASAAAISGPPPPDVPLLLDFDEVTPGSELAMEAEQERPAAGEEALPAELQALLEENQEEPAIALQAPEGVHDQAMADDMAEAEFYLSQGMTDEARIVHRRMQIRDAEHPTVSALADQIERALRPSDAPAGDEAKPPVAPDAAFSEEPSVAEPPSQDAVDRPEQDGAPQFSVTEGAATEPVTGFVNLGAELDQELNGGEETTGPPPSGPVVNGLLKELQKGVREHLDEKDYETHYNLGIAYKEMELYDEAIQEFRLTAREPKRALECADLVGQCYLAKGQPDQAVQDLQAGLAVEGHPREAYHNLRYDLGAAFEAVGDVPRALEQFEILQAEGARFLDVQARVDALRARVPPAPTPGPKDETPRRKKKKISFI